MTNMRIGKRTPRRYSVEESGYPTDSPMSDTADSSSGSSRLVENTIYFYSDVNDSSACDLNQILRSVDSRLQQFKGIMQCPEFNPVIHLRINSCGGDLFSAMAIVDTIKSLRSDVYSYVEGRAASAATLISIVAKKRMIGENSLMLIHQLSTTCDGTYEQLEDDHINNRRLMDMMKVIYKRHTKIPMKELEAILKRDLWWDSKSCLEYGLVDEILS